MENFVRMKDNDKREFSANFIFLDYENVSKAGLNGIEKLDDKSILNIFFSKNTASMPAELVAKISNSKCDVRFHEIKPGKNALDFVLSSLLGYFIHDNYQEDYFYIVSKDKGFEPLVEYWKTQKVTVKIVNSLSQIKTNIEKKTVAKKTQPPQKEKVVNEKDAMIADIKNQLKNEKQDIRDKVISALKNTTTKKDLHNKLQKIYKSSKKADKIYNNIKKYYK